MWLILTKQNTKSYTEWEQPGCVCVAGGGGGGGGDGGFSTPPKPPPPNRAPHPTHKKTRKPGLGV